MAESLTGKPASEADDAAFAGLVEEISVKVQAGGDFDVEAYVRDCPEHAERLRQLLPAIQALAGIGLSLSGGGLDQPPAKRAESVGGTLGDFRVLREIGRGGMGIVYEVEQVSLGRRMALKVLPFAAVLDERQLTRFRNEARAAASLDHPNIVQVHSVGCEQGVHYYAMQYIQGKTLAEVIAEMRQGGTGSLPARAPEALADEQPVAPTAAADEQPAAGSEDKPTHREDGALGSPRPLAGERLGVRAGRTESAPDQPPTTAETQPVAHAEASTQKPGGTREFFRRVADWGIQAAEGLEHAHQLGIVHRDVKPSNLLVDARGHLWVTDFGLAQVETDVNLTMTGDVLGTLRYMSPEQASGRSRVLDCRSDIYSLGVTLYELLTLRPPFPGNDRPKLLRQLTDETPPAPRQLNRAIPKELETIVLKAISKEPPARYATAQAMADDLRRFLSDEPIRARRPSLAERATKWGRRHLPIVWSAAVSLIVVLVMLLASTILVLGAYQREKTQRDIAEQNAARAEDNATTARKNAAQARDNAANAQRNYETAREAVQQMLTRVADEELARIPEMKEVRLRLLEDAGAFYSRLIELDPRDAQTYRERARVHELLRQYDKVRTDLEKAADLEPDNAGFHNDLASFLIACPDVVYCDSDVALLHARWAVRLAPRTSAYHATLALIYKMTRKVNQAREEYQLAAQFSTEPKQTYQWLQEACVMVGDWQGALENAQRALQGDPKDSGVLLDLAGLHLCLGQYQGAVEAASGAISALRRERDESAHPHAYSFYLARADAYVALKMYEEAIADYDKAVEFGPFRSYSYKRRAVAHFHVGDYAKSLADIAKAVELKPDDTSSLRWIPLQLVAKCPDERFLQGMFKLADKTVQLSQGASGQGLGAEAYLVRARLHAALGRYNEALADFDRARQFNAFPIWLPPTPDHAEAYVIHYGLLRPDEDRWNQALGYVRQHLRSDDQIAPAWLQWVAHWLPAMMRGADHLPGIVFVSDLPWVRSSFGYAEPYGRSPPGGVRETDTGWLDGITPIAGLPYSKSIHTHAFPDERPADVVVDVGGRNFRSLKAHVGPCNKGGVQFQILVDGKVEHQTEVLRFGTVVPVSVEVAGAKEVVLRVLNGGDGGSYDDAGWGFARFLESGAEDPLEEPPAQLQSATDANGALLLSEVWCGLEQKGLARRWFDVAAAWMARHPAEAEKLRQHRAEAAKLLEIAEEAQATTEKPEKPRQTEKRDFTTETRSKGGVRTEET